MSLNRSLLIASILAVALLSALGCTRPEAQSDAEIRELVEVLRAQAEASAAREAAAFAAMPASANGAELGPTAGSIDQNTPPDQRPQRNMPPVPAGGGSQATSPLIVATPGSAVSALTDHSRLVLAGTAWTVTSDRLPILRNRGLTGTSFFVFRAPDLQLYSPQRRWSFAVDYSPGDLLCRRMRPCFSIVDESNEIHPVWYQILPPGDGQIGNTLHILDCIKKDEAEGGVFPSDEALATNGRLAAIHRTEDFLCVRRLDDPGFPALSLEDPDAEEEPAR